MRVIPDQGLMTDGHDLSQADALALARVDLIAAGVSPFDADELLSPRRGLVVQAWWGGDDIGFAQEHHDGVQPVTVVNVVVLGGA